MNDLPPSTHNLEDPLQRLREDLAEANADLLARTDELLAGVERAPATVADEETASKMSDFTKQVKSAITLAASRRVEAKRPFLDGGRAVDAFFDTRIISNLESGAKLLLDRLTVFQRAKAEVARKAAEAIERQRRADEQASRDRMEALMRVATTEADLLAAMQAEDAANVARAEAAKAAAIAASKPAELSRTRGDMGAVASLRRTWKYEVVDFDKVPRGYMSVDPVKVNAAIKAGAREVNGLRIFEQTDTIVR